MELRQLQYFKAVAEEGGFGRAAERLHIVPSSVTVQVKRLERELGVALFDRTTRQVGLTEAGRALLPLADEVLAAAARATVAIGDLVHRQERRVVLGTSSGLGDRLDAILEAFARLEPDGELHLASGTAKERVRQVRGGHLDATLVRGGEMASSLEMVNVWSDALVAAVPSRSDLGGPGPLPLSALDGVPPSPTTRRLRGPCTTRPTPSACASPE